MMMTMMKLQIRLSVTQRGAANWHRRPALHTLSNSQPHLHSYSSGTQTRQTDRRIQFFILEKLYASRPDDRTIKLRRNVGTHLPTSHATSQFETIGSYRRRLASRRTSVNVTPCHHKNTKCVSAVCKELKRQRFAWRPWPCARVS
jgi:hypothetical protein